MVQMAVRAERRRAHEEEERTEGDGRVTCTVLHADAMMEERKEEA